MNDYISKYWSCYLSIGAIIVSLVSIMISSPRYTPINIDYLGVIAGVLSLYCLLQFLTFQNKRK